MSDLQCPMTALLVTGDAAVPAGCAAVDLSGVADVPTLRERIDELADLHRGETVAVVARRELIAAALGFTGAGEVTELPGRPIAIDVDSDGWHLHPAPAAPVLCR